MERLPRGRLFALCFCTWFCASAASLISKAMFQVKVSADGSTFNKPLTSSIFVAAAMSSSLIMWRILIGRTKSVRDQDDRLKNDQDEGDRLLSPLLVDEHEEVAAKPAVNSTMETLKGVVTLMPLSMSDLGTTICVNFATINAPASVVQMIASSGIAFTAVLTRVLLGTRYSWWQWFGVLMAVVGLLCTASSALLQQQQQKHTDNNEDQQQQQQVLQQPHPQHGNIWLGVGMALFGTCLTSTQQVVEEKFLKEQRYVPLQQVGIEGTLELAMLSAMLPLVNHLHGNDGNGKVEDVTQALSQIGHSPTLIGLGVGIWASLALYNPLSQSIGRYSGTVLRTFVSILRTVGVWGGGVGLYALTDGSYGECWHSKSWLQLLGFSFICVGLVLFTSEEKPAEEEEDGIGSENGEGEEDEDEDDAHAAASS